MDVRGHVTLRLLYPGKEPQCPLKCRLGGPQSGSEISDREWNSRLFGPYRSHCSDCAIRYVLFRISFGCQLLWLRFLSFFIRYPGQEAFLRGQCLRRSFWYLCNYVVLCVFCDQATYLESLFLASGIVRYNARKSHHMKRNLS